MKLLFFMLAITTQAFATEYGSVMLLKNGQPSIAKVELHPTLGNELKNEYVSFVDAPDLQKDENGCYCYPETDIRFAYVHAYYHATKQLIFFKDKVNKLVSGPKEAIKIKFNLSPDDGTWGMVADTNLIQLDIQKPAFDLTSLAHEIGHIIHGQLGKELFIDAELVYDYAVSEGTGNMLAALYLGTTVIGEMGPFPTDINIYVDSDHFYTFRKFYEEGVEKLILNQVFPDSVIKSKEVLTNSEADGFLNSADPYINTNIINQPVWMASQKFNRDEIIDIYLKAISNHATIVSYSDFAQRILDASASHQEIATYLSQEFARRGLIVK